MSTDAEDFDVEVISEIAELLPLTPEQEASVTARLAQVVARRAVIEQAKGVLMVIDGLDAGAAFEMLDACSQAWNVKVHVIAEKLIEGARSIDAPSPAVLDHLLAEIGAQVKK